MGTFTLYILAILTLRDESIPFFSDEAAAKILDNNKTLKYSLKEVLLYVENVRAIVGKLKNMTCRDYEISIFINHHENVFYSG